MKPALSLGAILAVVSQAVAVPNAKDANLANPVRVSTNFSSAGPPPTLSFKQALVDSIEQSKLVDKAKIIQEFAYASPGKNRFLGTPGLQNTTDYIVSTLNDLNYYHVKTDDFVFRDPRNGKIYEATNVIAETRRGDPDNVLQLGAHIDSVPEGPGMNDNASGAIGLLEIALQLALGNYTVNNAVRFSWWSAEEEGLVGSRIYVKNRLNKDERRRIRLYLNFDMIASPTADIGVYTSDFSKYGRTAPAGVKEAEQLFQDYFDEAGLKWDTVALKASSDHWPFLEAGIPTGGLHAGDDPNYHTAKDTVENMNKDVFFDMTKAIAHAVGTYAVSFDSLPPRGPF